MHGVGFIKLMRSDKTRALMEDPNAFTLVSVIAFRAQRTNALNMYGLEPGEALLGDCQRYGMTQRQYRTAKQKLAKWNIATFRATSRGTIAKLVDDEVYDIHREPCDNPRDSHATNKRQARDNYQEGKKEENEKKYSDNSDELRLAQLLLDSIREHKTDIRQPDVQAWAVEIGRMIRLDGRTTQRIEAVVRWCQKDSFWWKNILSARKLREHFDQLEIQMAGRPIRQSTRERIARMEQEAEL